ncbi:MAG: hypothetical protein CM1200mP3_15880 [Chloroflexota bacterium]|nr:MAG: hypothetical protein CM1200mP3_15880 [Chloroflexota bacterium]
MLPVYPMLNLLFKSEWRFRSFVNLATEKATVKIVETIVNITDLNKAVTQAGYRLSENEISHWG